jgi:response regulator of citrate/malate metabolism
MNYFVLIIFVLFSCIWNWFFIIRTKKKVEEYKKNQRNIEKKLEENLNEIKQKLKKLEENIISVDRTKNKNLFEKKAIQTKTDKQKKINKIGRSAISEEIRKDIQKDRADGYSRQETAEKLGVSATTVAKYELSDKELKKSRLFTS